MVTSKTFIIAEAGVNHNGDIALAKKLIEAAKKTGADAIKFQTFVADKLVSRSAKKARYQLQATDERESQHEMIRRLELDETAHKELIALSQEHRITFLSSPFDEESADLLEKIGVTLFKIGSGEITNEPLLKHIAVKQKPIILSTGMSTLEEVKQAIGWIRSKTDAQITLLHCVTEYPAPADQINLRAMDSLSKTFGLRVGYSDHSEGIDIAVAAVARGAEVIEKHFTMDRTSPGPDHQASLEPNEFAAMVSAIRRVEEALGDGIKKPALCEMENRDVARKSLIAAKTISANTVVTEKDIAIKRPGIGLPPMLRSSLVGRSVKVDIPEGTLLTLEMFK